MEKVYQQSLDLLTHHRAKAYSIYNFLLRRGLMGRSYKLERVLMPPLTRKKNKLRVKNRLLFMKAAKVHRNDGTEIHHKNGNALDNRLSNLEVLTKCEHAKKHGQDCSKFVYRHEKPCTKYIDPTVARAFTRPCPLCTHKQGKHNKSKNNAVFCKQGCWDLTREPIFSNMARVGPRDEHVIIYALIIVGMRDQAPCYLRSLIRSPLMSRDRHTGPGR